MEPFRTFRLIAVRIALLVVVICAGAAFAFDRVVAVSLAMGGLAGTLVFWVQAAKLEKLAQARGSRVYSVPASWRMIEFVVYAAVVWRAWHMAPGSLRGIASAAAGLFIIRAVVVFLGLTGFDLKQQQK